jgi:hypothetical protein
MTPNANANAMSSRADWPETAAICCEKPLRIFGSKPSINVSIEAW